MTQSMIFETELDRHIGENWKMFFFLKEFKQQLEFNFDELFPFRDTRLKGKFGANLKKKQIFYSFSPLNRISNKTT